MMLTGVTPFVGENEGETRRKMAAGVYPPEPLQHCSPHASDLVSCLMPHTVCRMQYVSCGMWCALCFLSFVLCLITPVLCLITPVLCLISPVPCRSSLV